MRHIVIHSIAVLLMSAASLVGSVSMTGNASLGSKSGVVLVAATDKPPIPAAKPADDTGAESFTATYGDWQLQCAGPSDSRNCQVIQTLVIQAQKAPFAQLGFGRLAKNGPLYFTAVVPVNVTFPSAVQVATKKDDPSPVAVPFTRCLPTGCFASIKVEDALLNNWKAQGGAGLLTITSGNGKDVSVPISFRGLSRALDELDKSQ